jgi:hypothetical protein
MILGIFNSHNLRAHSLLVNKINHHRQFVQLDTFAYFIKVFKSNVLQRKQYFLFCLQIFVQVY